MTEWQWPVPLQVYFCQRAARICLRHMIRITVSHLPYTYCRGITVSGSHPAGHIISLRDCDTVDAYIPRRDLSLQGSILRYVTMWCLFRRRYAEVTRRKSAPKGKVVIFPVISQGEFLQWGWSFLPLFVAGIRGKWSHKIPMIYY